MASIGPTLPPHLTSKRKREKDDNEGPDGSDDSSGSTTSNGRKKRAIGPLMPSDSTQDREPLSKIVKENERDRASTQNALSSVIEAKTINQATPRKSAAGPAMPPASLLERPLASPSQDESSDSDDDFGPALPGSGPSTSQAYDPKISAVSEPSPSQAKLGRDDWMLAPPTAGNRSTSIDPSKMKNRGFRSGPRAAPAPGGDMSLWTETPDEKRKRLEEEMLGIKRSDQPKTNDMELVKAEAKAAELAKKVQAYNDKNRAAPLFATKDRETDEDDPSKRAFDREKDIGGGKLSHTETKQMLNRAADFGSRFSKGSYL